MSSACRPVWSRGPFPVPTTLRAKPASSQLYPSAPGHRSGAVARASQVGSLASLRGGWAPEREEAYAQELAHLVRLRGCARTSIVCCSDGAGYALAIEQPVEEQCVRRGPDAAVGFEADARDGKQRALRPVSARSACCHRPRTVAARLVGNLDSLLVVHKTQALWHVILGQFRRATVR
eukprot:scaffold45055_cov270-Isochrysis_galbana.AAC.3